MRVFVAGAVLSIILAACSQSASNSSAPSMEQLRNATYKDVLQQPVTLQEGRFEGRPFTSTSVTRPVVALAPEIIATGDLTDDDVEEAVVLLAQNSGGSGLFLYFAIVSNHGGAPDHIATIDLGDRIKVVSLDIEEGKLIAELVEHGPDDPMCCPTMKARREWRLDGGQPVQIAATTRPQNGRFSGHLVWGHEARSFRDCDGKRVGWVINDAGTELVEVYEELTSAPYQEMFVEVRGEWVDAPGEGFGADYAESLRITELMRAESEGLGCRLDMNGALFVANGNEPFWRLHIRENGLSMWSMDSPGETMFSAPELSEAGGRISIDASGADSGIHVILEKQRCVDTMSGARYEITAMVELKDERLSGCAIRGL